MRYYPRQATALAPQGRSEGARARESEQTDLRSVLHDRVLPTLMAIARGGLDVHDDQVRQRCAYDADYLRGLIDRAGRSPDSPSAASRPASAHASSAAYAGAAPSGSRDLIGALGEAADRMEALGMRVHVMADYGRTPPTQVVEALALAAVEALNHVRQHAGVQEAWLGSSTEDGVSVVRIVNRGPDGDPASEPAEHPDHPGPADQSDHSGPSQQAARARAGLHRSLRERMERVGGTSSVDSRTGEGTSVELRWPA